ncbi:MAG: RNA polymerase sigma factor [Planctomycetota bacterium]
MPADDADSDESLALAAGRGAWDAFEQLVERYGGRVVAALERRVDDHHTAHDLAQEAWIRVHRALPRFDGRRTFRCWLFAIALNAARDEGRRRRRNRLVYADDLATVERQPPPPDPIEDVLQRVPEPFRSSLQLVDLEGLSYEEAAVSLRCAVGTVKSRVSRGRLAFRDHWQRANPEATWSAANRRPGVTPQ